jgi:hypothetical protein
MRWIRFVLFLDMVGRRHGGAATQNLPGYSEQWTALVCDAGQSPWSGHSDSIKDVFCEPQKSSPTTGFSHRSPNAVIETVFGVEDGAQENFPALFRTQFNQGLHLCKGSLTSPTGRMSNRPHPSNIVAKNALLGRFLPD